MNLNYNSLFSGRSSANKKEILDVGVPTSGFSKAFRLLMISLLMICTGFSFAQTTVTIPAANTNSGSVRQPLATWFGYERAAMIYTSAQIGSTGTITNVRFYLNSVSSPGAATDVRVYMKERTTTFTATSTYATETTGATLVYGPVTLPPSTFVANTWIDLPLSTTFNYTGGSNNLEVIVETNATGGGSGESSTGKQFRYNTQASNQFYQNWAADTNPPTGTGTRSANRPNAQLVFAASLTPPNCAASLVPAASATGVARNVTLSWGSGGGGPTSYDVYFGSSAGAPFVGNQVGTTYSPSLLSANTTYYWKIVPKNANGDATGCVEQSFTTGTGFNYCSPTYSNGSGTGDGITNVTLGSLNNTSGNSASPFYTFFNAVAIPTLAQSTNASVSVTFGSDTNQFSAVWIDFNQNGTFEASEGFLASGNAGASGTSVINVTVPSGATLGNTRMRVRGGDDSALTTAQACGASNSTWGETEDYIVNIIAAPTCLPASGLSVSAITSNSASLSWVAPSPAPSNGYEWAVTTSSTPPSSGTSTSGTTASASGLSASTLHYLHVRSSCGIDGFSPWATTTFTTGLGCGSTFYDNGGAAGNYTNNLNTTTTIFPNNVGDGVIATFTAFGTESCCDSLSIYDGPDATYPLIGTYAGTTSPGTVTSTNSASGALTFVFNSDISLTDIGWAANISCFTFPTDTPDYVNLQFPATATILAGNSATVYAQVYEGGLTDVEPGLSGQAPGIEAWIGISPIGSNSNPNTWTTWIPATHNAGHVSNNDEYQANIGSTLTPGTYYYASRFRLNGGPFVYGGNPFNAWDGTTSVSGVLTVNPNPTQCATNVAPLDAATNVTIGTVALSWAAPTSGPAPTSYDVYYGTTSGALTLATNTTSLSYNASAPAYSTTYYWRIVPKSAVGGDATGCSEWSFTTQPNPFAPYCSTITYSIDVEPITSVNFAGITNTSSNTVDGSPALENFISISGNVTTENSYTMTLKGNTAGNFTTNFRVFIDWNQDGDFADLGETFNAGSVTNSNGLDAISAVSTIAVPSSALAGSTRMRIKKLYSLDSGSVDNPCTGGQYGQTEDYTLNVTLCTPLNWYADNDGDTFGDPTTLVSACNSPGANYVLVSGDCNDANPAVNPNATEVCYDGIDNNCDGTIDEGCTPIISVVQTAQCGSTLSSINQQIFANLVAGAQGYRFRVTDMTTNQVQTIDRNLRVFQLTQLTNYAFDRTYQVEVSIRYNNVWQPFYGAPCMVTTPATTTQVQTAQCGGTLTTIGDAIYANNVPFATGYKFRITNLLTSAQEEVERPLRDIKMTQTSIAEFNSTYSVEVAVRNTNGAYLPYGTPCNITTPSFPTTQLQLAQCDVILTNPNTIIYADSYAGATTYRFRFTNTSLGYTYQFDKPLRSFALNTVPGLLPGETYSVQVSIEIGGVFGPFGKVCTLTTPGSARATETTKPALAFSAIVSPNPFGESFGLEVTASTEESIQVKVYDMLGKLVESREVDATTVSELQIGATYPSGVYNVIVSQGDDVKTLRVIKR